MARDDLDDLKVGPLQLLAVRAVNLVIEAVGRVLDVAVLLVRPRLLWAYLRVWGAELWRSPYRWPRSFEARRVVQAAGQTLRELMYGEVLVATGAYVLARAGVGRASTLLDVGAGRGRALLAARLRGARARGVELWEPHVRAVGKALEGAGVTLEVGDATQVDYGGATHVLLNWCAFSDETKARVTARLLETCRPGTRFIAVTRAIQGERFRLLSTHTTLFSWGLEKVFIQELSA
ncbi:MAG TPA: class I SAM-dependent methyltransferase [Myxococcales bacterium]|nr:class I SAM-dependent methyltransferase [Myxococcales bacterium]